MRVALDVLAVTVFGASNALPQDPPVCRLLCGPEFHVEPTVTFGNLFQRPRIVREDGTSTRESRETDFEVIPSLGLPTRARISMWWTSSARQNVPALNFELDTSLAIFNWLPNGRWLKGVELEGSLDFVASGLPRSGDRLEGVTFVDRASPWSFSVVFVLPIAPM